MPSRIIYKPTIKLINLHVSSFSMDGNVMVHMLTGAFAARWCDELHILSDGLFNTVQPRKYDRQWQCV